MPINSRRAGLITRIHRRVCWSAALFLLLVIGGCASPPSALNYEQTIVAAAAQTAAFEHTAVAAALSTAGVVSAQTAESALLTETALKAGSATAASAATLTSEALPTFTETASSTPEPVILTSTTAPGTATLTPTPTLSATAATLSATPASATPTHAGTPENEIATTPLAFSVYLDKLLGGWTGQMIGVQWGNPTEFKYTGNVNPENVLWKPQELNMALENDDLYVEIPFLEVVSKRHVNANWGEFGESFRWTNSNLWHANKAARDNLRNEIAAPASGHYSKNPHAEDIDWQIEANFAGLVSPGMPEAAVDIAWRAGHVVGYGDGVYGGVAVAAMQSAAFFAEDVDEIVEAGRLAVPAGSKYRQVIEDVIAWSEENPDDWYATWQMVEDKWGQDDRCPDGVDRPFNIDAKLNGAYVFMALLYGGGNFETSVRLAMKGGQDSDCNASTVGGILGAWLGFEKIPYTFTGALNMDNPILYTDYTFQDAINMSADAARGVLVMKGGSITQEGGNEVWLVPVRPSAESPILEQWPQQSNDPPLLTIKAEEISTCTFKMTATASDKNSIHDYQWFFGDLSYARGLEVTHTYRESGSYHVIGYVTDGTGNTSWKEKWVQCK